MQPRNLIIGLLAALAVATVLVLTVDGDEETRAVAEKVEGQPHVEVISPRNGSRQENRGVVVKLELENFKLAPLHFGQAPQLGEGHIKFALNRVPDCVDPEKLERAINSPLGSGRLNGRSFDHAKYSGPNGLLAERLGTEGLYSPATKPEIYYEKLPPGFYRLTITLARNDGTSTPYHAVTNFQVLPDPRLAERLARTGESVVEQDCEGKVSSAEAAEAIR